MPLQVGQTAALTRTFTQRDFDRFAALSGDDNPIHTDPEFSARTRFGRTVAHGMLLYSTICRVLGSQLPGPGTIQLEQDLVFPAPTYTGEEVTVRVEVVSLPLPGLAELRTLVSKPSGESGCEGRTLVRLPDSVPLASTSGAANPHGNGRNDQDGPVAPAAESARTLRHLALGQTAGIRRVFTPGDIAAYVELTGDANPVLTDQAYARSLGLESTLVPGGLLGGLFSYLLGMRLPGRGTNWLKQTLRFNAPAYTDREIDAQVEIVRLRPEKQLANLRTVCTAEPGVVCSGEALVYVAAVRVPGTA
jgi:acyl dehydratase